MIFILFQKNYTLRQNPVTLTFTVKCSSRSLQYVNTEIDIEIIRRFFKHQTVWSILIRRESSVNLLRVYRRRKFARRRLKAATETPWWQIRRLVTIRPDQSRSLSSLVRPFLALSVRVSVRVCLVRSLYVGDKMQTVCESDVQWRESVRYAPTWSSENSNTRHLGARTPGGGGDVNATPFDEDAAFV